MEYSYRFRIYPTEEQKKQIAKTIGAGRFVFNYFLQQRKDLYETEKKSLNWVSQSRDLTALRNMAEYSWLKDIERSALQNELRNLEAAYKNFFRRVKNGEKAGFPRFKSRFDQKQSYRTSSNIIRIGEDYIWLPKLGNVKCVVSKAVEGRPVSATVSHAASGKYFVSVCCVDVDIAPLPPTGAVVGLDLGLRALVITSDGVEYANHKYLAQSQKKLAKLQRDLARKQKGSANREKARLRVARLNEHIANQRKDTLHNITTELVRTYDVICIEDLDFAGMQEDKQGGNKKKSHNFSKSLADASLGEFRRQLEYKAAWYGKTVVRIDRNYPVNQICSICGNRFDSPISPEVKRWSCPECGTVHDRNFNAAKNILAEGVRQLNSLPLDEESLPEKTAK